MPPDPPRCKCLQHLGKIYSRAYIFKIRCYAPGVLPSHFIVHSFSLLSCCYWMGCLSHLSVGNCNEKAWSSLIGFPLEVVLCYSLFIWLVCPWNRRTVICNGNRTEWKPIRSVIIPVIGKIGRPRSGCPICLITSMVITERIGRHEVLLPINNNDYNICDILSLSKNTRYSRVFANSEKKKNYPSARARWFGLSSWG